MVNRDLKLAKPGENKKTRGKKAAEDQNTNQDPNQTTIVDACGPNGTHFTPRVPRHREAKNKAPPAVATSKEGLTEGHLQAKQSKKGKMETAVLGKADKGTQALLAAWKDVTQEQKCQELYWSAIRGTMKALSKDMTPVQMCCEWHGINYNPTDPANQPPQPQKANENGGVTCSPPGKNFVKAAGDLFCWNVQLHLAILFFLFHFLEPVCCLS